MPPRRSSVLVSSPVAILAAGTAGTQTGSAAAEVDTSGPYGSMRRTGSHAVALTFDDGPDPAVTPKLPDRLERQKVKATVWLTGPPVVGS